MSRQVYRVPAEFAAFDYDAWTDEDKKAGHEFTGPRGEKPPEGECWQLWQDVGEESPISPVFADRAEFVVWVAKAENASPVAADKFVEEGWAPSMIGHQGLGVFTGVQMAAGVEEHLSFAAPEGSAPKGTRIRHRDHEGLEGVVQYRYPDYTVDAYVVEWERGVPTLLGDEPDVDPGAPMTAICMREGFEVIEPEAVQPTEPEPEVANGLFGPGIFGTGIDLSALDEQTAYKLGQFIGEQTKAAEERGYVRGMADRSGEQIPGLRYLLWDMERQMWWAPARRGYTDDMAEAGRYSEAEAVDLALQGSLGGLRHATVIVADHGSVER